MIIELLLLYALIIEAVGLLLSYAIAGKKLSWFEHSVFGFILGLIIPNAIYATLYLAIGLEFNVVAWLGLIGIIGVISIVAIIVENKVRLSKYPPSKEGGIM